VEDKPALRARLRATRDAFALTNPPAIAPPAPFRALLRRGMIVASYVPIGGEADPAPLARAAVAHGCTLALPHVIDRATPIAFLPWAEEMALTDGPFGLRQPAPSADTVAPDLVLTPLVAFDRAKNRVGQGAGHYDRAFAEFPRAIRIGVAWSVQEVAALTPDSWDALLHAIVTEKEWIA
jgi:5-formyltetrahydrofolate cyclo-ligase